MGAAGYLQVLRGNDAVDFPWVADEVEGASRKAIHDGVRVSARTAGTAGEAARCAGGTVPRKQGVYEKRLLCCRQRPHTVTRHQGTTFQQALQRGLYLSLTGYNTLSRAMHVPQESISLHDARAGSAT